MRVPDRFNPGEPSTRGQPRVHPRMTIVLTPAKVRHALKRKAHLVEGTLYRVDGAIDLGDKRYYSVRWDPDTGAFECSCGQLVDDAPGIGTAGCMHVVAAVIEQKKLAARRRAVADRRREHEAEVAAAEVPLPPPSERRFRPPGEEPFPDWVVGFRRPQWEAIEAVMGCYEDPDTRVVMLQAPTGSGKTLMGETARRLIGGRGLYICSTKTLQDQAARDFPYAEVLKGRANYPTLAGAGARTDAWGRAVASPGPAGDRGDRRGRDELTAADCTATGGSRNCRWCDPVVACPYRVAREKASRARLAILNTSYFLVDVNKGGGRFRGRDLAIIDEADLLEGELLNQAEVVITQHRMRALGIPPPRRLTADFTSRGVRVNDPARAWLPWVTEEAIPRVRRRLNMLPPPELADTKQIRERRGLAELLERLEELEVELPRGGWVFDGYDQGKVIFRPIEVGRWGKRLLWPHARRFLLMSGTIISADEMARTLGLDGSYRLIDVSMTFPAANRPVNVVRLVEVRRDNQAQAWPKIAEGLAGVLALHPDDRVLVHTVSYPFAEYLAREVAKHHPGRPIMTYDDSRGRDGALERYKTTPGAVMLAPSMDRGIDLPGELCRVQVVAKVPYPNLGDKRTKARLWPPYNDRAWYAVNTVRTLVQMTGRGIRGVDDQATTYILDHTFTTNVWKRNRSLLPAWWCEALNMRYPTHRLRTALNEHTVSTSGQHTS